MNAPSNATTYINRTVNNLIINRQHNQHNLNTDIGRNLHNKSSTLLSQLKSTTNWVSSSTTAATHTAANLTVFRFNLDRNFSSSGLASFPATATSTTTTVASTTITSATSVITTTASAAAAVAATTTAQTTTTAASTHPPPYHSNLPMMIDSIRKNNIGIDSSVENEFEFDECMDLWAYNAAAITLFFIGLFGFTFNACVIILMCKNVKQWTPTNVILLNLVCSDFSVSIFGNPFTLIAAISHRWIFGNTLCVIYGFFMALLGITSITTLTVLAYERYCLIKFPLSTSRVNNRSTVIRIIIIWLYSLALTTPPLFGWGAYVHEAANISCSVNWESRTFNATTYIVFLFIFGLVIPLIVITYSYVNIISTMKMSAVRLGRKNRAEKRINIMVAVMIFAFMLAWTPYSAFALLEQFGPTDLISPQLAVLPALIAKSSICYNPLIYVGLNPQLRNLLQKKLNKDVTANETTINQLSQNDNGATKSCSKLNILALRNCNKNAKFDSITDNDDGRGSPQVLETRFNRNNANELEICEEPEEVDNENEDQAAAAVAADQDMDFDEFNYMNNSNNLNYLQADFVINRKNLNYTCCTASTKCPPHIKSLQINPTTNLCNISTIVDDDQMIDSKFDNKFVANELHCNENSNKSDIIKYKYEIFIDGKTKLVKSDLYSSSVC